MKNTPRYLDYRRQKLPLHVALSFGRTNCNASSSSSSSARDLILAGRVRVNNVTEQSCHRLVDRIEDQIVITDSITDSSCEGGVAEHTISIRCIAMPKYYICYKPRGVVCSRKRNEGIDREDSVLISDWLARTFRAAAAENDVGGSKECSDGIENDVGSSLLNGVSSTTSFSEEHHSTIKTVGRLDEESEGLLLLTNDGSFSRLLCDPEFGLEKTYRVVVRGSCYSKVMSTELSKIQYDDNSTEEMKESVCKDFMKKTVTEMIERGNDAPTTTTDANGIQTIHHFPFESCTVLDVGRLPNQHSSDDSFYALVDLVLCEGKRHAVRRIISNARLRVCYLSRISVEGLDGVYPAAKPETIAEADEQGCIPGGRHRDVVVDGKVVSRDCNGRSLLYPGHVIELRDCDVDRIFSLRSKQ